jgi:hypothetical protein
VAGARAEGATREGIELRLDSNLDVVVADEDLLPDSGRYLEHDETLLAEGRTRVSPHGSDRSGVVEALVAAVQIDGRDDGSDVGELDACRDELGGIGVPEILRRVPREPSPTMPRW